VIVAEKMQNSVHDQMRRVVAERLARRRRLPRAGIEGEREIAEFRVGRVRGPPARRRGAPARGPPTASSAR